VFLDPHDYRTFKKKVSEEDLNYSFEATHYLEFIEPIIERIKRAG